MSGHNWSYAKIEEMVGRTFDAVERSERGETLLFRAEDIHFEFIHLQECCEDVYIEDVCGDLSDLVGVPILTASERTNTDKDSPNRPDLEKTYTWTFYEFRTIKGSVTVRWVGSSNGAYSEGVYLRQFPKNRRTIH